MMDVEADDRRALDAVRLQSANRDCDIVERAEPFAVIGEGVMEPPADVDDDSPSF